MVHLQTRGRCELGALAISAPFRTKKRTNRVRFEFENPRRNGIASTRQRIFRINASRHALADRLNSNNERRQWFDRYAKFHSSKLRSWANIYGLIQVTVLADSIGARNTTVREAFTHQLQGNLHKNYVRSYRISQRVFMHVFFVESLLILESGQRSIRIFAVIWTTKADSTPRALEKRSAMLRNPLFFVSSRSGRCNS